MCPQCGDNTHVIYEHSIDDSETTETRLLVLSCNCFIPKNKLKEWHAILKKDNDEDAIDDIRKDFKIY